MLGIRGNCSTLGARAGWGGKEGRIFPQGVQDVDALAQTHACCSGFFLSSSCGPVGALCTASAVSVLPFLRPGRSLFCDFGVLCGYSVPPRDILCQPEFCILGSSTHVYLESSSITVSALRRTPLSKQHQRLKPLLQQKRTPREGSFVALAALCSRIFVFQPRLGVNLTARPSFFSDEPESEMLPPQNETRAGGIYHLSSTKQFLRVVRCPL